MTRSSTLRVTLRLFMELNRTQGAGYVRVVMNTGFNLPNSFDKLGRPVTISRFSTSIGIIYDGVNRSRQWCSKKISVQ